MDRTILICIWAIFGAHGSHLIWVFIKEKKRGHYKSPKGVSIYLIMKMVRIQGVRLEKSYYTHKFLFVKR